jgi:HEAT repeat protein
MLRRIVVIVAAVVLAALIGLWLCDGPVWRSATVPANIRTDVARLHSWRGSTRAWACRNLATGGAAAAPFLIEHVDDAGTADGVWAGLTHGFSFHGASNQVMVSCVQALQAMGREAVPALIVGLNTNPREMVRHVCAELLAEAHDARALPHLQLALFDASNDVRNIVIDSLAAFCDPKIVKWSRSLLHEDDQWQRASAVRRLGQCDSPDVQPDLEAALQDPEPPVVREAELALKRRHLR